MGWVSGKPFKNLAREDLLELKAIYNLKDYFNIVITLRSTYCYTVMIPPTPAPYSNLPLPAPYSNLPLPAPYSNLPLPAPY